MSELKRWNFEDEGNGVLVCKDQHEKGSPCEYEPLTAKDATRLTGCIARKDAEITTLRQKLADSEARVADLENVIDNRNGAWLFRKQAEAVESQAKEWNPEEQTYSGRKPHKELVAEAQRLRQQADELEKNHDL